MIEGTVGGSQGITGRILKEYKNVEITAIMTKACDYIGWKCSYDEINGCSYWIPPYPEEHTGSGNLLVELIDRLVRKANELNISYKTDYSWGTNSNNRGVYFTSVCNGTSYDNANLYKDGHDMLVGLVDHLTNLLIEQESKGA